MKKMTLLFFFVLAAFVTRAQDITQGLWYNDKKTAKVQFYWQGDKLNGKIVWLKEPTINGKPRVDKNNPEASLQNKPLVGLIFMKGFIKAEKNLWNEGSIYDPENGKTYQCKLTLVSPTQLDVRGFIGFSIMGRTSHFTKAE
mgnify:FL=1|jgi:uncharacterized protein (DUF2147 family)